MEWFREADILGSVKREVSVHVRDLVLEAALKTGLVKQKYGVKYLIEFQSFQPALRHFDEVSGFSICLFH